MVLEYMRTAKKSYMVVKEADFSYEPYELTMILKNDIPCLIPFQVILEDGSARYWYDATGMQSVKAGFSMENIGEKRIRVLLESLIEMKSAMEAYLLDDNNICYSPETVCYDRACERVRFCYVPGLGSEKGAAEGLAKLFEEILRHLNHSDRAAVQMAYEMYERCAGGSFTAEDCMDCLRLGEQAAPESSGESVGEQEILWEKPVPASGKAADDPWKEDEDELEFLFEDYGRGAGHRRKRKKERKKRSGEEEPVRELPFETMPDPPGREDGVRNEDEGRTEIISGDTACRSWELIYKGNGTEPDIRPADFPFLIGTDKSRADGVLHARTVSRIHAKLYVEEGRLFVEDFNSTNGTYLNNNLLPMSTPAEVAEGDRIVFATEEFAVCCRRR